MYHERTQSVQASPPRRSHAPRHTHGVASRRWRSSKEAGGRRAGSVAVSVHREDGMQGSEAGAGMMAALKSSLHAALQNNASAWGVHRNARSTECAQQQQLQNEHATAAPYPHQGQHRRHQHHVVDERDLGLPASPTVAEELGLEPLGEEPAWQWQPLAAGPSAPPSPPVGGSTRGGWDGWVQGHTSGRPITLPGTGSSRPLVQMASPLGFTGRRPAVGCPPAPPLRHRSFSGSWICRRCDGPWLHWLVGAAEGDRRRHLGDGIGTWKTTLLQVVPTWRRSWLAGMRIERNWTGLRVSSRAAGIGVNTIRL